MRWKARTNLKKQVFERRQDESSFSRLGENPRKSPGSNHIGLRHRIVKRHTQSICWSEPRALRFIDSAKSPSEIQSCVSGIDVYFQILEGNNRHQNIKWILKGFWSKLFQDKNTDIGRVCSLLTGVQSFLKPPIREQTPPTAMVSILANRPVLAGTVPIWRPKPDVPPDDPKKPIRPDLSRSTPKTRF